MADNSESDADKITCDAYLTRLKVKYESADMQFKYDNLNSLKNEYKEVKDLIIRFNLKPVLGIDIYQYSQYELPEQIFIPVVFDLLFQITIANCNMFEKTLFTGFKFGERFISTGDGGFIIFDNLFQAIVFNINFHLSLRLYNSGTWYKELSDFAGELIIRSCITYDFCYLYKDTFSKKYNFYGTAIINNARILAKDKLNRFLIDDNTYKWFLMNIKGIENLTNVSIDYIARILNEHKLLADDTTKYESSLFPNDAFNNESNIKLCLIQKIGKILSKKTELNIYNIQLQRKAIYRASDKIDEPYNNWDITVGNLNTSGISEDE